MDVGGYVVYTAARPSTGKELKSFKGSIFLRVSNHQEEGSSHQDGPQQ